MKVMLTKKQIEFVIEMTAIPDKNEAVKRFGNIMAEEGLKVDQMQKVVEKLMEKLKWQN